jgi:hypothetical protein
VAIVALWTLDFVGSRYMIDQPSLFVATAFITTYPTLFDVPYRMYTPVAVVAVALLVTACVSVGFSQAYWADGAFTTGVAFAFTVLTFIPQRFMHDLRAAQREALRTLAAESRAQHVLVKRVIPEVFVERLLRLRVRLR